MSNEPAPVTLWDAVGEFIVRHPEMTLAQLTEDPDLAEYVNEYSVEELQGLAGMVSTSVCEARAAIERARPNPEQGEPKQVAADQPWRSMSEAEIDDLVLEQLDVDPIRTRMVHSSILCTPDHDWFPLSKVWESLRRLVDLGLVKRSGQTSTTSWAIDA